MKKMVLCLAITLSAASVLATSAPVLYKNMANGATLTVDLNVSATNSSYSSKAYGITRMTQETEAALWKGSEICHSTILLTKQR